MQKDQKAIYYITAETYESAKGSLRRLEIFTSLTWFSRILPIFSMTLSKSLAVFSFLAFSSLESKSSKSPLAIDFSGMENLQSS
jgi:hypothetical protein